MTLASAAAWLAVFAAARLVSRRLSRRWGRWFSATAIPLATLVAALIFRIGVVHLVVLTGPVASNLDAGSEIVLLVAGAWLVLRLLAALTLWLSETFVVPLTSDDPENRRTKTNVYIVRRLGLVLVAILAIGYLLLSLGAFDTFGLSLLASAGVLGVVLAIAAQPLLGNMVAGLQIALSDPVRIGDVVVYNDHWGTVEDISFAHTVIRTAKETRLIVPHSEFLSRAFENWSKEGEPVRRIVKIAADYRIDVDLVRRKIGEIVQDDPRLAEPPLIEMVETEGDAVVLWIWIMGTTAFTSWYLHNEVREKLIAFLRDHEEGLFLPRQRHFAGRQDGERLLYASAQDCLTSAPTGRLGRLRSIGFLAHRSLHGAKMSKKPVTQKAEAERAVKDIRRRPAAIRAVSGCSRTRARRGSAPCQS